MSSPSSDIRADDLRLPMHRCWIVVLNGVEAKFTGTSPADSGHVILHGTDRTGRNQDQTFPLDAVVRISKESKA